ncbi:MAG TPA: hypothetical protein VFU43_15620 [Streptosporangiaceae bacterium]|nr:hypothetical protein [Streptosporangiaceae bacterium]
MLWATVNDGGAGRGSHIYQMSPLRGSRREAEPMVWLARLRRDFPDWAFLFDPWACVWVAVQGRYRIEMAASAHALHESLENVRSAGRTRNR